MLDETLSLHCITGFWHARLWIGMFREMKMLLVSSIRSQSSGHLQLILPDTRFSNGHGYNGKINVKGGGGDQNTSE